MASYTAIASSVGTISSVTGDKVIEVIAAVVVNGIQINPDGGRLRMLRTDGTQYTSVASVVASTLGQAPVTLIKIPA